jgi:SAM-dependent methyltransferase
VLFTASDLGVFSKLAELEKSDASTLASELKLNPRGIRLLLDACVALDLLIKEGDVYSNTGESSAFLVPGSPSDLSSAIRYNRDVYSAWGNLRQLVETGRPVEKPEIHLGDALDRTRSFVLSMHQRALGIGQTVLPMLDMDGCTRLLDVGGGPGTYSRLIAKRFSSLQSTVLDLPEVVKIADELTEREGMSARVATLAGDYRSTPFPSGQDAVIFFGVLHQESPESIVNLFNKAYDSLNPGGLIYVMDMMTDQSHASPEFSALFAVNMALTTDNGWVFSDSELKEWMLQTGFTGFNVQPLPAPMPHWLASACKI